MSSRFTGTANTEKNRLQLRGAKGVNVSWSGRLYFTTKVLVRKAFSAEKTPLSTARCSTRTFCHVMVGVVQNSRLLKQLTLFVIAVYSSKTGQDLKKRAAWERSVSVDHANVYNDCTVFQLSACSARQQ